MQIKTKIGAIGAIMLVAGIPLFFSVQNRQGTVSLAGAAAKQEASQKQTQADTSVEERAVAFLQQKMRSPTGLIYYSQENHAPAPYSVLESMGQLMEYAALNGDTALLENTAACVEQYFRDPTGYYYWKVGIEGDKEWETSSALVDDLRLAKAYLIANQRETGRYDKEIKRLADVVLQFDVNAAGYPCDYYDGAGKQKADMVSLFYLDTETMDRLGQYNDKWRLASQRGKEILMGMPDNRYGFYPQSFAISTRRYSEAQSVNMVENLYTAIDAHYAGKNTQPFAAFLKQQMKKGKIYNHYSLNGTRSGDDESTAVYALAARFLALHNDQTTAALCYRRALDFQIQESGSLDGAFGDVENGMVYAFDQLEAILMLKMLGGTNVDQ